MNKITPEHLLRDAYVYIRDSLHLISWRITRRAVVANMR